MLRSLVQVVSLLVVVEEEDPALRLQVLAVLARLFDAQTYQRLPKVEEL